jgi:hypothetical protein
LIDNHAMPVVWVAARHRTPEIAASAKKLPGAFGGLLALAIAIFAAPARTLPPLVTKHDRAVARRAAQASRDVFGSFDAAVQFWIHGVRRHAPAALIYLVAPPQERPPLLAWRVWVVFRTPDFVAAAVPRLRFPLVVAALPLPLPLFAVAFAVAESAAANALAPKPTGTDDQAVEHGQRAVDYEHAVSAEMGSESVAVSPG